MKGLFGIPSLILCLTVCVWPSFGTDLNGRVVITKRLSKRQIRLPVYQLRGATRGVPEEHSTEWNDIAIFLEGQLPEPDRHIQAELKQEGQRFEPQLVIIPVGSTVSFPNADPIFHNVFSLSGAKRFDLGYYPAGQTRIVRFDQPGVVQVYCHLHPNMYAAIVVAPNRWYSRLNEDGNFSFHDVPPGTYQLVAWHINAGFFRREVQVQAATGKDVLVEIPIRDSEAVH